MNILSRLRKDAQKIWDEIGKHPFIIELCQGTLPLEKFKHYVLQDYHFLLTAIKNFSLIASKAEAAEDMVELAKISGRITVSEYRNHLRLLKSLGLDIEDAQSTEPIPIVCAYSDFLISASSQNPFPHALVSILPCFWSYGEIIKPHREKLAQNPCLVYRQWAAEYSSEPYFQVMGRIKRVAERVSASASYDALKYLFLKASRYEYIYWDDIYKLKGWPI